MTNVTVTLGKRQQSLVLSRRYLRSLFPAQCIAAICVTVTVVVVNVFLFSSSSFSVATSAWKCIINDADILFLLYSAIGRRAHSKRHITCAFQIVQKLLLCWNCYCRILLKHLPNWKQTVCKRMSMVRVRVCLYNLYDFIDLNRRFFQILSVCVYVSLGLSVTNFIRYQIQPHSKCTINMHTATHGINIWEIENEKKKFEERERETTAEPQAAATAAAEWNLMNMLKWSHIIWSWCSSVRCHRIIHKWGLDSKIRIERTNQIEATAVAVAVAHRIYTHRHTSI